LAPLPDLTLTASDITVKPAKPKEGETVTISATIYNTEATEAKAFSVSFLVDGKKVGDKTVTLLAKGTIVREVSWKAKAGNHTLTVAIDPDNHIGELSDLNNGASVSLSVAKAEAVSSQLLMIAMIAVIIIVVLALAAVLMMRRKKPTVVIPYQPPPAYTPVPPQAPPPQPPAAPMAPPPQPPAAQPPAPPAVPPPQPPAAPPATPVQQPQAPPPIPPPT
jgi:hypothetical protein